MSTRAESAARTSDPAATTVATTGSSDDELRRRLRESEERNSSLQQENEHLRRRLEEVQAANNRLVEFYDRAPVGHLTLDADGVVEEANLTAANLLGVAPQSLKHTSFERLVAPESLDTFLAHRSRMRTSKARHVCEVVICRPDGSIFDARLECIACEQREQQRQVCLVALSDITQRKRKEEALRQSEELFRQLVENTREVLWMTDPESDRILYVSPGYESIWGRPCRTLYEDSRQWMESIVPEDRLRVWHASRHNQVKDSYDEEYRIVRPDGELRWIHDRAFPVRDPQGRRHRIVGVAEDITQRKRAEAQLQLQSAALEAAANGIAITDRNGVILWGNAAFCRMTGYPLDEVIGQTPSLFRSGRQKEVFYREMWATILAGRVWEGELLNRRKDGSIYAEEMTITPVPDSAGEISHFIAIKHDITLRKRAEEALRHSEQQYRLLFDTMEDGVVYQDDEGCIISMNRAAERILGKTKEEFLGQTSTSVEHDTVREDGSLFPGSAHPSMVALRTGSPVRDVVMGVYNPRERTRRWINITAVPLFHEGETRPYQVYTVFDDITERRQAEGERQLLMEQLEEAAESANSNRAQFEAVFEAMQDGVVVFDMKGDVAMVNQAEARICGYDSVEELKHNLTWFADFYELLLPGGEPLRVEHWPASRVLRGEHVEDLEVRTRRKETGQEWFFSFSGAPVCNDDGRQILGLIITRDITARKRAEAERARLAAIVESSQDAIIGKSLDGIITSWNAGAERLYGYTAQEIIGQSIETIVPPDRREEFHGLMHKLRQGVRIESYETARRRCDGSTVRVSLTISPIKDGSGNLVGASAIARNITRRKEMEEALRVSEQTLADFFNQSPLGLFWVDPDGHVLRANRAQLELIGRSGENALGEPLLPWFVEPDQIEELLRRIEAHETLRDVRTRLRHKDGTVIHALIDANGLWHEGRYVHSRWFIRDITRRVELEREILRAVENEQRRIGQDLHDDLCQQLSGLEFLTQTLANELKAVSIAGANRALEISGLLRQSIDSARALARGLSPVEMEKDGLMVALRDLAESTGRMFRRECRFVCARPVMIDDHAVSTHLYRITQEAVSNAIRHGTARCIEIVLVEHQRRIIVAIRDNGVGIPDNATNRKGMGVRVMQYRAGVINGSLVVQRRPEGGTEVVCTVERHD